MFREKGCPLYGTYETKSKFYLSSVNKEDKDKYFHPCCKPMQFIENHIINSTKEGDIVVDPFMGSGSTMYACKRLNRKYIGFEIDEKWYAQIGRMQDCFVGRCLLAKTFTRLVCR